MDIGRKTAVAHGFEALVSVRKRKRTRAEELNGRGLSTSIGRM